ncbi:MAG: F0F1 ATP synthase subunit B [Anaerolineae bacterium]|nr:F0F1 ATP synthase subunit B [Anaerolineae bacterium]
MEKLGINLGFLIVQILNFGIVFVVLYAWVYKPLQDFLAKRREKIAQGIEDARVAEEARANAEKAAEKILMEAQTKANEIVQEASDRASSAAKELKASADAEIAKLRENAKAEVEIERNRVLADLRGQVAALAMSATQKLIGESLDEKRQHALLQELFSGIKNGKVVVLEDQPALSGAAAEITSALPLDSAEQEVVKKDVLSKLGNAASVSFKVDPSILGGLVLRVGDRVVDASVAGQLEGMRQKLQ